MTPRACIFCRFYFETSAQSGECRVEPPAEGAFPATKPELWCGRFFSMDGTVSPGRKPKISDQTIIGVVRDEVASGSAYKRAALVQYLGTQFGTNSLSPTAALSRVLKLVRHGIFIQGDTPPGLTKNDGDGIYLWLSDTAPQPVMDLVDAIRAVAPDQGAAKSMRTLHRECNPESVALSTFSGRLNALVASGAVLRTEDGYYAAPTEIA